MRIFAVCAPRRPLELCLGAEKSRIPAGSPTRPASRAVQPVGGVNSSSGRDSVDEPTPELIAALFTILHEETSRPG